MVLPTPPSSAPGNVLERREFDALALDSSWEANPIDDTLSRLRSTNLKSCHSGRRRGSLLNPGYVAGLSEKFEDVSERSRSSIETTSKYHDWSCNERGAWKVDWGATGMP
jgi:hypothetical protein